MPKSGKIYSLERSPFFRLRSLNRLKKILRLSEKDSRILVTNVGKNFICGPRDVNGKVREISTPKKILRRPLDRLQFFFSRIELPDYYMSKKGSFYKTNAEKHLGARCVLRLDIESFYSSAEPKYFHSFLMSTLQMSRPCADFLVNLATNDNCIPTGSPPSQLIAFFSYKKMFDKIHALCMERNIVFSLFVDDMTISSYKPLPSDLYNILKMTIESTGLRIKRSKTKFFNEKERKYVTGCIITRDGRLLANNNHKKNVRVLNRDRRDLIKAFGQDAVYHEKRYRDLIKTMRGKVQSIRQVEPLFRNNLYQKLADEDKQVRRYESEMVINSPCNGYSIKDTVNLDVSQRKVKKVGESESIDPLPFLF